VRKLIDLYGKPVTLNGSFRKEPYIIFKDGQNRFTGNGGYNDISGTYKVNAAEIPGNIQEDGLAWNPNAGSWKD